MSKTTHTRYRAPLALALGAALVGTALSPLPAAAQGTEYFVDCGASQPGTGTEAAPWNSLEEVNQQEFGPGDSVLFHRGSVCTGTLRTAGSGSLAEPLIFSDYGSSDERAVLDGDGAYTVIHLYNQEHVVLDSLEVTNAADAGTNRRGITVELEDFGLATGITIHDIYLHDIVGDDEKGPQGSQGIVFRVTGTEPSTFHDVQITNNRLHHINRQAINVQLSDFSCRPEIGCDGADDWLPATGVVVRGNHLTDIGGDGIVMNTTDGAVVEHNVIEGFNVRSEGYNAGIWPYNSDNFLGQFNDVSGGMGTMDGMAYDIDGGNIDATFQYNRSHNNEGGFFLLCTHDNIQRGTIVRYNLSENDEYRGFENCMGEIESAQVYNNTIYIGDGVSQVVVNEDVEASRNVEFFNNIVYQGGSGTANFDLAEDSDYQFENNVFSPWIQDLPENPGGTTGNPLLCNPGTAVETGSDAGYRLQDDSPAIGTGQDITDAGGRDYFGTAIGSPPTAGITEIIGCEPMDEITPVIVEARAPVALDRPGTAEDYYSVQVVDGVDYFIDGAAVEAGTYRPTDYQDGVATLEVTTAAQPGYELVGPTSFTVEFTDEQELVETGEVQAPTADDQPGRQSDTFTIPSVEGVEYLVDDEVVAVGTHAVTGYVDDVAIVDIAARPAQGYVLPYGSQTTWSLTFDGAAEETDGEETTPGEQESSPGEDETSTPEDDGSGGQAGTPPAQAGSSLPDTGVRGAVWLIGVAVLLAMGVGLRVRARVT